MCLLSLIYYNNVREVQNISSKLINQTTQIYYYNLGDKLSYHFGLHLKELLIQRNKHISHQSKLAYIYIYMTFCERLIYSMNVLSMTMVSYYLHTSPRQTNPFLISLSLRNKLLILFPNVMQTNLKGMIISRWRYSRYVPRKLLSLCKLFFKNVYLLEHFPTFGSIFSIFRCCRFVGKS